RGAGFAFRGVTLIITFLILLVLTWTQMKKQRGIRRIEMQFFVLNLGAATLFSVSLAFLSAILQIPSFRILSIVVVFSAYLLSAWAIAFYRVFDLEQVLYPLTQRIGILFFLAVGVFYSTKVLETILPQTTSFFLSSIALGSVAFWLDVKSKTWLDLDGEQALANTRRKVIEAALSEPNPDKLIREFGLLLGQRAQISFGTLLFDRGEHFQSQNLLFEKNRPAYLALCAAGWATPESLERRRKTPDSADLHNFLAKNCIGLLIVASPEGIQSPSLLIALGRKATSWPFTYPEVRRFQNVAELMDSILTRSRLTAQAAAQARVEHLAMLSRGLAHDLKNLITPVSSFLIHTENHYAPNSLEADVHSTASRSVRMMTDYVSEALFFSKQLDPRFEPVDIAALFADVAHVTASRAAVRKITLAFQVDDHVTLTADAVLLQRVLGNLVNNAIDASGPGEKVKVSAGSTGSGKVRFQVTDEGSGISAENLSRVFDPYFTTKEFGDEVRGFGLGLTICQKIVQLHAGTILVESVLNHGTIVSVDLPVMPLNRDSEKSAS
ncbi:MAG: HAMP domain-containing sensor histidine kinase, partial [Opitutaceae bacterium]